jgi:exosortase
MTTQPLIRPGRDDRAGPHRRGAAAAPPGKVQPPRRLLPQSTPNEAAAPVARAGEPQLAVVLGAICLACGAWSYWPTMQSLAATWSRVTDYSHGFLVLPIAVFFLWARRDVRPPLGRPSVLLALVLMAAAVAVRGAGDFFFFTFLDGWSILPWAAAVAAALGGWPLLRWSAPAIAFLIFMVPLPFSMENDLSRPLQQIATTASTYVLQCLGQPAFAEGNIIWIGEAPLKVEQACSGLRLFMGVIAMTYVCVVMLDRPWWERGVLLLAAAPIAIIANSLRIVATGLLYPLIAGEELRQTIHDAAGFSMLLVAGLLFLPLLWFLRAVLREEEVMDISAVVKHSQG